MIECSEPMSFSALGKVAMSEMWVRVVTSRSQGTGWMSAISAYCARRPVPVRHPLATIKNTPLLSYAFFFPESYLANFNEVKNAKNIDTDMYFLDIGTDI
jgi:hypothetical protein